MSTLVTPIPCLTDNYAYLIERNGRAVVIDPSEAEPVMKVLEAKGLRLESVWNTHHHWDHVGGNRDLKKKYECSVVGSWTDRYRVPEIDTTYEDGETFQFAGLTVEVLAIPGHTIGAIAYYLPEIKSVFTGDTLFILGCGRLFEGTPEQMWDSLTLLMNLPKDTLIYCGHEYTKANAAFAKAVYPEDASISRHVLELETKLNNLQPSVPGTIEQELLSNPFLRAGSAERFAELRSMKDKFRS